MCLYWCRQLQQPTLPGHQRRLLQQHGVGPLPWTATGWIPCCHFCKYKKAVRSNPFERPISLSYSTKWSGCRLLFARSMKARSPAGTKRRLG